MTEETNGTSGTSTMYTDGVMRLTQQTVNLPASIQRILLRYLDQRTRPEGCGGAALDTDSDP